MLGFLPIAFGIWAPRRLWPSDENSHPAIASTVAGIAAVTFANGADNIGVFTPLLRNATEAIVAAAAFLALVGVWCALGALLGNHRFVVSTLGCASHGPRATGTATPMASLRVAGGLGWAGPPRCTWTRRW